MTQSKSQEPIKILGICGSLQMNGTTKNALRIALDGAVEYGAEVELIELRDLELVFFGSVAQSEYPADVERLRNRIRESQGVILATPEYHGSLSGTLKNMLDLMTIDDFETKIVGLVGIAGGHTGAINSLNTMKTICRNLHCWVLPQDVSISNSSLAFGDDGNASDPALQVRLLNVGRQAVKFASLQQKVQQDDFMAMWKTLPTW
jgi:FMN reductase